MKKTNIALVSAAFILSGTLLSGCGNSDLEARVQALEEQVEAMQQNPLSTIFGSNTANAEPEAFEDVNVTFNSLSLFEGKADLEISRVQKSETGASLTFTLTNNSDDTQFDLPNTVKIVDRDGNEYKGYEFSGNSTVYEGFSKETQPFIFDGLDPTNILFIETSSHNKTTYELEDARFEPKN